MLEEIEFNRLAKLRLEVDEPENVYVHCVGHIQPLSCRHTAEVRMESSILTIKPTIVSIPSLNARFNPWIVSNIIRQHRTIRSYNRYYVSSFLTDLF